VERVERDLSVNDVVLLIVDAAGGAVEGRTAVQKLAYFAGIALQRDLGHHAHYYGPYSRAVESALISESFSGDLEESVTSFQSSSGPDIRKYHYKLTEQGRETVAELRLRNAHSCSAIDAVVEDLQRLVPGLSQHPLSLAAKVDYIASNTASEPLVGDIPQLAREHGWPVSPEDVQLAADILVGLKRAQAPQPPA
jgi:uncharacterized protein YwgA